MATLIVDTTNCPTRHLDLQDDMALGSKTITDNTTRTFGTVLKTDRPSKVRAGIKLSAGAGTLEISVHADASTPNFAAPDASLDLAGTDGLYVDVATTLAKPHVSMRIVDTSDSTDSVVESGFVEVKGLIGTAPGGYHSATNAFNAIDATTGGDYSCATS